jgi:hypothetical protein
MTHVITDPSDPSLLRAPALPAQSSGGRFGRAAEPPFEEI